MVFCAAFSAGAFGQVKDIEAEFQDNATSAERKWARDLKQRAEQGNREAQSELGRAYLNGTVFKKDPKASVVWIRAAAENGFAEAQLNLGVLYYVGGGVPRDSAKAYFWIRKAADQGDPKAEQNLGIMYSIGEGVKRNLPEAIRWYTKAAEKGHPVAAYNIGMVYEKGIGVPQDETKAYMWHSIAATRLGYALSEREIDALNNKLSPSQISEAKKRADEWVQANPDVKAIPID